MREGEGGRGSEGGGGRERHGGEIEPVEDMTEQNYVGGRHTLSGVVSLGM